MAKKNIQPSNFLFAKENYILFSIGLFILFIGYILMIGEKPGPPDEFNEESIFSFRKIVLAPMLILFGFLFEIYAIMKLPKKKKTK